MKNEEYKKIPDHFKQDDNNILKIYKDGYSLSKEDRPESYFYKYPIKGTDSNGKKKILQSFRSPLAAIIISPQLTLIATNLFGIIAGTVSLLVGLPMIGIGIFLTIFLLCGAMFLPKLWNKSQNEESYCNLFVREKVVCDQSINIDKANILNQNLSNNIISNSRNNFTSELRDNAAFSSNTIIPNIPELNLQDANYSNNQSNQRNYLRMLENERLQTANPVDDLLFHKF